MEASLFLNPAGLSLVGEVTTTVVVPDNKSAHVWIDASVVGVYLSLDAASQGMLLDGVYDIGVFAPGTTLYFYTILTGTYKIYVATN